MRPYLLDTTALIDYSKQYEPVRGRVQALLDSDSEIGVCGINVAEFFAGVPPARRHDWDDFFASLTYWEITMDAAVRAGGYRHVFARVGVAISLPDALTAAVAAGVRATIVTRNVRHFPMDDVTVLDIGA